MATIAVNRILVLLKPIIVNILKVLGSSESHSDQLRQLTRSIALGKSALKIKTISVVQNTTVDRNVSYHC